MTNTLVLFNLLTITDAMAMTHAPKALKSRPTQGLKHSAYFPDPNMLVPCFWTFWIGISLSTFLQADISIVLLRLSMSVHPSFEDSGKRLFFSCILSADEMTVFSSFWSLTIPSVGIGRLVGPKIDQ